METSNNLIITSPADSLRSDIIVIGSGPGGAVTACYLSEAGRDVLIIEEGPFLSLESALPFSRDEMTQKYRNGGLTATFGNPKISYVEGRCVGGGSEINSGLYHRLHSDILDAWRDDFKVDGLNENQLRPHFEACEKELHISLSPGPLSGASIKLMEGANRLGWASSETPRLYQYQPDAKDGTKQSMTKTFIPRALAAGCRILPNTRALKVQRNKGGWQIIAEYHSSENIRSIIQLNATFVFLACGAIQTPNLLLKSGISLPSKTSLRCHPTVKVVARFPDQVNRANDGVPAHQIREFAPRFTLGSSISSVPYLALALADHPDQLMHLERDWQRMSIYYAMTTGGSGKIRSIPFFKDPFVSFALTENDLSNIQSALYNLCRCVLSAGADLAIPSIRGAPVLKSLSDLSLIPKTLPRGLTNLMTVHLFSSCPMGEDRARCVTNSYGKVFGLDGIWIADASILCGPPGVNPQGTIMAITRRNVFDFLKK